MMRRLFVAFCVVSLSSIAVLANNPHYVVDPTITISGTDLVLSAKAAGLGDVPDVDFTVTGTLDVFSRCYNHGGNKPQADNKQETINVNATFSTPVRNGQTTIHNQIVATATSTLNCPGNQVVVIESIDYDLLLEAQGFPGLTATLTGSN
jgi:hypothetical protein